MSSSASGEPDKFGPEDRKPSETIRNSVRIYFTIAACAWLGFEVARKKFQKAYYCRDRSPDLAIPAMEDAKRASFWKWIWPMYKTSDDVIMSECGLDTLFYLRFLRMCQKIAAAAVLMSAANFPVYYYAPAAAGKTNDGLDPLYRMTMSHLTSTDKWRMWFPLATIYIMSAWTCYLLYVENKEFVKRRHEFMSRKQTQQYSVVINGLPKHLRTQQTLRNYLNVLFPNSVLHLYVALECGDLETLVAERAKVRNKLEHVLAKSAQTGERVLVSKSLCGGEKVDAIELYQDQLKNLNDAVEMETRAILRNQAALANEMMETSYIEASREPSHPPPHMDAPLQQSKADIAAEALHDETEYIRTLRQNKRRVKDTGIMRGTGFVTFNNLKAAQSAQQILQSRDPTEMSVEPAPHVEDVVWENIGISYNQRSTWILISYCLSATIILFWTVPTIFVVNLSKVDALSEKWPWLARTLQANPWLDPLLQQLSPLMLTVMNALAPIIFGILSKREGHASGGNIEGSLFSKLVYYQFVIVFLLPIIGGSLSELISSFKDPKQLVQTMGKVIPTQSSFFISLMIVQMGLGLSLELLRVVPIIKAQIYKIFAPKLTPRERESAWFGLAPLSCPGDFGQTDNLASYYLVLILVLVFAPIAPILCYFGGAYFFLAELVYRWSVLCVYDPSQNAMGVYFPALYRFCIGAVLLSQVMMIILLGLKQAPLPAAFSLALPPLTVVFHLFIATRYPRVAEYLPLDECTLLDAQRSQKLDDLEKILEDIYRQPAMAERAPIQPDYRVFGSELEENAGLASPPAEVC
ncbi:TPA: hypothetical protein N0F65_009029 [Lagenidium giganteum]|uniref:DUF221-domain-containing protein n=1 Tax=Lagenidium giganteum TaxID=4803 RepID=A0AAV2YWF0_9STRA|nr:TPA: hypothetical protein N0F65_009029 [Lagenidium giganteum]